MAEAIPMSLVPADSLLAAYKWLRQYQCHWVTSVSDLAFR